MATQLKIKRKKVLPATGENGEIYILQDRGELHIVQPDGTLLFSKGLTLEEETKLADLPANEVLEELLAGKVTVQSGKDLVDLTQITKLAALDTQAQTDTKIAQATAIAGGAPYPITGLALPQTPGTTDLPDRASANIYGDTAGRTYTQTGGDPITISAGKGRTITYNKTTNLWTAGQEFTVPQTSVTSSTGQSTTDAASQKLVTDIRDASLLKADVLTSSANIFNKATVTLNQTIATNGANQGSTSFDVSDFIPVVAGQTYVKNNRGSVAFYTNNSLSSFITGSFQSNLAVGVTYTAPTGATYMRNAMSKANAGADPYINGQAMIVQGATVPSAYVAYQIIRPDILPPAQVADNSVVSSKIANSAVTTEKVNNDAITLDKISFKERSSNLTNMGNIYSQNGYINPGNGGFTLIGDGTGTPHSYESEIDYIPILPSTQYSRNRDGHVAFYDANRVFISGLSNPGIVNGKYTFTTPANAFFKRESVRLTSGDAAGAMWVLGGTIPTYYIPFGYKFSGITLMSKNDVMKTLYNKIYGKKWVREGDSITAANPTTGNPIAGYAQQVIDYFGLNGVTIGLSGSRMSGTGATAMNNDARIANIPLDTDILTCMAGTNDVAGSTPEAVAPLGTLDSTDVSTFYGAWNVWVQKVYARVPNAEVILCTFPYKYLSPDTPREGYPEGGLPNGLYKEDYRQAIRNIARKYGYLCIDVGGESGINGLNWSIMTPDGVHPGALGNERISRVFINGFKKINP